MKVKMLLDNCFNPDVRVYKEAKYLVDRGHEVEILAMDKKNVFKNQEIDNYDGIYVRRFFPRTEKTTKQLENIFLKHFKIFVYFYWLLKFMKDISKYLKNADYEVIHCHDYLMAFIATLLIHNKVIVFDMHEFYLKGKHKSMDYLLNKIIRFIQNRSDYIIYVNPYQCKFVQEKNKAKLIYLPNYPEITLFANIEKTPSMKLRVSYIGAARDYDSLINLLRIEDSENVDFFIHGMGSAFCELMQYAKSQKKESRLTGSYQGITEIESLYQNTDLLYCVYKADNTNWSVGYPVKLYEAIITLTPIIVNKASAYASFVEENEIGFVIDMKDDNFMEKLMIMIKQNPDILQKQKERLKRIQFDYTWESVAVNLNAIYK